MQKRVKYQTFTKFLGHFQLFYKCIDLLYYIHTYIYGIFYNENEKIARKKMHSKHIGLTIFFYLILFIFWYYFLKCAFNIKLGNSFHQLFVTLFKRFMYNSKKTFLGKVFEFSESFVWSWWFFDVRNKIFLLHFFSTSSVLWIHHKWIRCDVFIRNGPLLYKCVFIVYVRIVLVNDCVYRVCTLRGMQSVGGPKLIHIWGVFVRAYLLN